MPFLGSLFFATEGHSTQKNAETFNISFVGGLLSGPGIQETGNRQQFFKPATRNPEPTDNRQFTTRSKPETGKGNILIPIQNFLL